MSDEQKNINQIKLNYTGTKKQWENITKNPNWKSSSSIKTIVCSDKKVKAK